MNEVPFIVSTEWLEEKLNDPKLRLIDVSAFNRRPGNKKSYEAWSGKEAYEKEHIPGAVFADLLHDLSDPDAKHRFTVPPRERFIKNVSELGIGDSTYAVVYDQGTLYDSPIATSYWASRFAWQLRYEGFNNVAVLDGGLHKWKTEGRPVTDEPGNYPPATFTGERRPELLATKEDVIKAMDDENTILMNCLSPEIFKGEIAPYKRGGHIPGSVNVFFGDLNDTDTKELLDDARLCAIIEKTGALDPDKKVITYCGGGLAATWNALVLNKLGQKNVAMYDGSMSEWADDPSLPLHTIE